jgi:ABC-type multidrug transport system fused ATPase/permease subunit
MDGGRIAEAGTHQDLLALGGTYTALAHAQSSMTDTPELSPN